MLIVYANKYYKKAQFILCVSVLNGFVCLCVCISTYSFWPFYKLHRVWEFPSCSDLSIRVCVCVLVHFCVTLFACVFSLLRQPPDVACCVSDHSWLILLPSQVAVMLVKGNTGWLGDG